MVNFDNFYYFMYRTVQDVTNNKDAIVSYLYPHGSTDPNNLCVFGGPIADTENYRFLFYDQEPLCLTNATLYNLKRRPRGYKHKVIFGNSECSKIKQDILQHNRNLVDCHYFAHGFAALDWYRANRFFCYPKAVSGYDFLINCRGINGNRAYRPYLLAKLNNKSLLENAVYSMSCKENNQHYLDIIKHNQYFSVHDYEFVQKNLQVDCDITYDDNFSSTASAVINEKLYRVVKLQIVAETCFFEDRVFLTEKVFQPIVTKTPFLLAAGPGSLQYLKSYGFKTYEDILPQLDSGHWRDRLDSIVNTTEWFCNLYPTEKNILCEEMQEIAEYNYNHFYGDFFEIIYEELKTNIKRTTEYCNSLPLAYSNNF
jgi:hypothetical protein